MSLSTRQGSIRSATTLSAICPKALRMATYYGDHNRTYQRSEKPARRGSGMGCDRKSALLDRWSPPGDLSPRSEDQRNQVMDGAQTNRLLRVAREGRCHLRDERRLL